MQFAKVVPRNRGQIYLLFYKPGPTDHILNHIVAFFDGPFSHVEMAFPERSGDELWEKEIWGSSIYQNETVFFRPRTYQREGYVSFALEMSMAQVLKVKSFCQTQAERQVPFNRTAMYASYLPMHLYEGEGTFCSKHVTMALQHAMLPDVMHLNPSMVTPSLLYKILTVQRKQAPIVQVVPSKLKVDREQCGARMMIKDDKSQKSEKKMPMFLNRAIVIT